MHLCVVKQLWRHNDCPQNILLWLLNLYYWVPLSCFFIIMWYNVHVHLKSFLFSCILLDNDNSFSGAMITFLAASDIFKKFNCNKSLWVYCSKLYMISKLRFSLHTVPEKCVPEKPQWEEVNKILLILHCKFQGNSKKISVTWNTWFALLQEL